MTSAASSSSGGKLPIGLVFYPEKVDKAFNLQATHTQSRIGILSQSFDVHTFKVNSIEGAYRRAQEILGETGQCAYIEFSGHGDQYHFEFSNHGEGGSFSTKAKGSVNDLFKNLLGRVGENGTIVVQTCEGGSTEKEGQNLLQYIATLAKPCQRVIGTSAKLNYFEFYEGNSRHFHFSEHGTDKDVTRIYQKTLGGNIQYVPIEEVELLSKVLGDGDREKPGGDPFTIELAYEVFAKMDDPKLFLDLINNNSILTIEKLIEFFHELKINKESGTIWCNILQDLEQRSKEMGWDSSEKTLSLLPDERRSVVTEDEVAGTLTVEGYREKLPYEKTYHFLLSLSAMERYSGLIIALDNGKKYSENPAAKVLHALTGSSLHSDETSSQTLLSGASNVIECTKLSYRNAKKKGTLLDWFKDGFGGVCLDAQCDKLFEYFEKELSDASSQVLELVLNQGDSIETIINKCAEFYINDTLAKLNLLKRPPKAQAEYIPFILEMRQSRFYDFVESQIKAAGIVFEEFPVDELKKMIDDFGDFWTEDETVVEMKKEAEENFTPLKSMGFETAEAAIDFAIVNQLYLVNLLGLKGINDFHLKKLTESCPEIHHLSIEIGIGESAKITDEGVKALATLKGLSTLNLGRCKVTDEGVKALATLNGLTTLNLSDCSGVTDEGVKALATLKGLTTLYLSNCSEVTDEGVKALATLKGLTTLNLSECSKVTDEGVKALAALEGLTALNIGRCRKVTDESVKALATLKGLTALNLCECVEVTVEGVKALATLKGLTTLDLSWCSKVTNGGVKALTTLKRLTTLNLSNCRKVTDEGVKALTTLEGLTSLDLSECVKVTDEGVKALAALEGLTTLDLSWCSKVTDEGVKALAALEGIMTLNLGGCMVTDEGVKALTTLKRLTTLDLSWCSKVTDEGVKALATLKGLTTLNLAESYEVTDEGVKAFRKQCTIVRH